jgi:hypothetical protein
MTVVAQCFETKGHFGRLGISLGVYKHSCVRGTELLPSPPPLEH